MPRRIPGSGRRLLPSCSLCDNSTLSEEETKLSARDHGIAARVLVVALLAFGLFVVLFAPTYARLFGAAYLVLGLAGALHVFVCSRFALGDPISDADSSSVPWSDGLLSWSGWILAGLGAIALGASFYIEEIALFYRLSGIVLLLYGLAIQLAGPRIGAKTLNAVWRIFAVLAGVAGVGSVGFVLFLILRHGLNLPFYDEYMVTLPFVSTFESLAWDARFERLTALHTDHRVVTVRLIMLLQLFVQGTLNFQHLMLIGFGALVAFAALLYRAGRIEQQKWILFAPVLLVIFQIQYHQLIFWGTISVVQFSSLMLAMATFVLLDKDSPWAFAGSVVAAVAATYSFAPGMFAFLIGLLMLIQRARFYRALIWLVPMTASIMLYFRNYEPFDPGLFYKGPEGIAPMVTFLFKFLGAGAALGHLSDFESGAVLTRSYEHVETVLLVASIGGVTLVLAAAYVTLRGFHKRNPALFAMLLYLLINAGLAAYGRYTSGTGAAFISRYVVISVLLVAVLYWVLAELHPIGTRRLLPAIAAVALLFNVFSFHHSWPYVKKHNANLAYAVYKGSAHIEEGLPLKPVRSPLFSVPQLDIALKTGAYTLPHALLERELAGSGVADVAFPDESRDTPPLRIVGVSQNRSLYEVALAVADGDDIHVVLEGGGKRTAFPARTLAEMGGHVHYTAGNAPEGATHLALIPSRLAPGSASRIGLMYMDDGSRKLWFSELTLPAIRATVPVLGDDHETIFHHTAALAYVMGEDAYRFVVPTFVTGKTLELPDAYTIQAVIRPVAGAVGYVLSNVDDAEHTGILVAVQGGFARLWVGDGETMQPIAQMRITPGAWNFITFAVDGDDLYVAQRDLAEETEAQNFSGEGAMGAKPADSKKWLYIGGHPIKLRQKFDGQIYEVRVSEGAIDRAGVDAAWAGMRAELSRY